MQLLDIAVDAAEAAAKIIRERAREARSIPWQVKSHSDFVTDVDTSAERAIRDVIQRRLPTAEILGVSEGAVKVRLHRAHTRLRELVG